MPGEELQQKEEHGQHLVAFPRASVWMCIAEVVSARLTFFCSSSSLTDFASNRPGSGLCCEPLETRRHYQRLRSRTRHLHRRTYSLPAVEIQTCDTNGSQRARGPLHCLQVQSRGMFVM